MWLRFVVILGCFLLVLSDDSAAVSIEDTLDDVQGGANIVGAWIKAPHTRNQGSAESEDDDRDLNTGDDNDHDLNTKDENDGDLNEEDDNDRDLNTEDDNDHDLNTGGDNDRDLNTEDDNDRDLNTEDDNDHDLNTGDDNDHDLNTGGDNDRDLNTGGDNDRDLNTEDDNDHDLNTGDDNDRDLNTGGDNDRDLNTEGDNDRDLNTGDDNDRDLNTGGDNDRDLNTGDDNYRDLNTEDGNGRDLNTGGDNDRDLNTEDGNGRDLNTGGDNDRDLNTGDDNDRDLNTADDNDRDLNTEGDNNRDPTEEDNNDRDLNRGDNDRDLNRGDNDRDLNIGNDNDDHSDENANDKDGHDRGSEQIQATTTLPDTKQTTNRHADDTSNKKSHVTKKKGKKSTRVNESQRGKIINNKVNKAGFKSDKIVASNHTGVDPDLKSTREGTLRKKRLRPNSASPSIQLIILVVGAVLACVLITGFIRWRVRKRLNNKKLGKMADNLNVYRSRMALPKTSIMDTIYECECEDRVSALHAQSTNQARAEDDSLESTESMTDELYCSHKFDNPHSIVSSRHYDADSFRSYAKSSKGDREFDRVRGSKSKSTGHKRHHHHKGRYSRHHRRKHHDKTHPQKAESISPTSEESGEENLDNISCLTSLLEQTNTAEAERTADDHDPVDTTVIPVDMAFIPVALKQTSPQQPRGIIGSMLNTWYSLSFNREWVGRMWQEKHNVRRISDVLRNVRGSISNTDSDGSPPEEQTRDDVVPDQSNVATASLEHTLLTTIPDAENGSGSESILLSNVDHPIDSTVETLFHSEEAPEIPAEQSGCHDQSVSEIVASSTACGLTETSLEAERSQTSRVGALPGFLSFNDYNEEPPEYESLLDSQRFSNHSTPLGNIEHPRHHRRHRRKRTEGRERSSRHLYSRVQEVDSSHTDSQDPPTSHSHEEHTPFKCDHKPHDILTNLENQSGDASTVTTPLCSSDTSEDTNISHPGFTNSPSSHAVPPVAVPFVPQEGIVLEQLSDGAQIIYLPPPALPSYHNDTPPPYHK